MNEQALMLFAQNALTVTLMITGPVLLVSLVIGSIVSLIQAATQINEVTLTFVPKILSVVLIFVLLGSWMGQQMLTFTADIFNNLTTFIR
jgi:flagellar biosynthetic protein FliQ